MRRMLKHPGPVHEYIRQAVQSGTYRTQDEIALMKNPEDSEDGRITARRLRHNLVRGSSIHDYPAEYVILQQHPPFPDPPRTPKKVQEQRKPKRNERIETLVNKYYDRHQYEHQHHRNEHKEHRKDAPSQEEWNTSGDTDWYYRQLLGVSKPSGADSGNMAALLSTKSVALQQAYNAAVHHYQLERAQGDSLSQEEIMQSVDAILATAQQQEKDMAAAMAEHAQAWRDGAGRQNVVKHAAATKESTAAATSLTTVVDQADQDQDTQEVDWLTQLQGNPRIWEALQRWSDRLQAVPYGQWTVGASTALDHWIAVTVLGVSEDTWQAVLQGEEVTEDIGPAIVAVREALFPETILDGRKLPSMMEPLELEEESEGLDDFFDSSAGQEGAQGDEEKGEDTRSIEDLLAELGTISQSHGARESMDVEEEQDKEDLAVSALAGMSPEDRMTAMTDELQEWRRQKHAGNLDETVFYGWSRRYMETLGIDKNAISYEDFAQTILSDPPLDRETSDIFWDHLSSRAGAEALAQKLSFDSALADMAARFGLQPGDGDELWNVAALRPLLDEYASESDRQAFLSKYGDILLEGIPLEHLVVATDKESHHGGTVPASSLPAAWAATLPATARVRVQTLAFRSNVDDDLYALWKEHKAGRARYEEKLFRTKRLGLVYGQNAEEEEDDDDNDL